ncbi:MAG: hypothetical protein Kow0081_4960 [Candidatus Dojkabacteria bacterium]
MDTLKNIRVARNLYQEGVHPNKITLRCNLHRSTVYRLIKKFKTCGIKRTLEIHKKIVRNEEGED